MASQCSLICMSVLVAISIQQQLTMDCDELVPSTSNYQSDWSDNTGNNADSSLSSCTYGTDVISSNCSNGTLHFFGWFSCVHESRFIPMVYWRTIINGTAKAECESTVTVNISEKSTSLICFGFFYDNQDMSRSKNGTNITIGEYKISEDGIVMHPGSKSPSTCPVKTTIQPDSTSLLNDTGYTTTTLASTTTTLASTTLTTFNIISSTSISTTVSLTSDSTNTACATTPACNCPMSIQQTEPWVHVLYCVIIVVIILISVIVFLLIFIHQQKNKGHYTFNDEHTSSNIYNTRRRQNDELDNADMYAQIPSPYTTQENKRVLTRTPSEYLDPVSMRKNRRTTSELRELSPALEEPGMHTYELVVRKNKPNEVLENGKEETSVSRMMEQACKESEKSQLDNDGKDTMELLPQMDPTYDYVQLPLNSQEGTSKTEGLQLDSALRGEVRIADLPTTQDVALSTTEAPDNGVTNNCTVFSNTETDSREDEEAISSVHEEEETREQEIKETREESDKESEFEDDDDLSLKMSKV